MNRRELSAMLYEETESIAKGITGELLKTPILTLPEPTGHFNFSFALLDIALRNNRYIGKIKNAILLAGREKCHLEYQPVFIERFLLSHFSLAGNGIHLSSRIGQASINEVCTEVIEQQQILRKLDNLSYSVDANKRMIGCFLYGRLKISIPGVLYYLIIQQKAQFMSACHSLGVQ